MPEGYNTAVSCLEAEGDDITVKWYNDASHLTPDILNAAVKPNQGRDNMADEGARFPHLLWFRHGIRSGRRSATSLTGQRAG